MLDRLFKLTLILNLTGLSAFIAGFLGGRIGAVTSALLAFNLFYLIYRWPVTRRLLQTRPVLGWTTVYLLWPLAITLLVAALEASMGREDARTIGLFLYQASLFLAAAVFVQARGWREFRSIMPICLAISALGFLLTWVSPGIFQRVAVLLQEPGELGGRAFGFFGRPNLAAMGVTLIGVVLVAAPRAGGKARLSALLWILALAAATGSRGGTLLALIVVGLIAWEKRTEIQFGYRRLASGVAAGVLVTIVVVGSIAVVSVLAVVGNQLVGGEFEKLGLRMRFWGSLESVEQVTEDPSLSARLEAQDLYLEDIAGQPLTGHGPHEARARLQAGEWDKKSHNSFIENAFAYGVPYVLFFAWMLWRTWSHRNRRWVEEMLDAGVVGHVVLLIFLAAVQTGSAIEIRGLIAVLGAMVALLVSPRRALRLETPAPAPRPAVKARISSAA